MIVLIIKLITHFLYLNKKIHLFIVRDIILIAIVREIMCCNHAKSSAQVLDTLF